MYWGAPDIIQHIPQNTFIDYRKFKNYNELERYLRNMDECTYNEYIENINAFLASDKFTPFTQEHFAKEMITLFNSYF